MKLPAALSTLRTVDALTAEGIRSDLRAKSNFPSSFAWRVPFVPGAGGLLFTPRLAAICMVPLWPFCRFCKVRFRLETSETSRAPPLYSLVRRRVALLRTNFCTSILGAFDDLDGPFVSVFLPLVSGSRLLDPSGFCTRLMVGEEISTSWTTMLPPMIFIRL